MNCDNCSDCPAYVKGYEQGQKDLFEHLLNIVKDRYPEAYERFKAYGQKDN